MRIRINGLSSAVAAAVKSDGRSPQYGHPAHTETATGYGPCRHCLNTFREGEDQRILFTYNAFEGRTEVPLPGPVFIHANECERFSDDRFPEVLRRIPMLFEAYLADGTIRRTEAAGAEDPSQTIAELLSDSTTAFVNLRNAEADCHIAIAVRWDIG